MKTEYLKTQIDYLENNIKHYEKELIKIKKEITIYNREEMFYKKIKINNTIQEDKKMLRAYTSILNGTN